ncbi:rod shape-determining protein MreC [Lachnospiraceae bacterium PF1-21]|uniref:Cell shape-determining protein MreC n=1 Tax=Ohessyouella blattaphilus TaxID=2949333 RepID=A0ABT1EES9_9FIRM|nr:rod shape-determining protein MreC [Ohessyouella blattaphilus]MCP1109209.1 rod shape-determining protein MreC [Ohessyouella blattaphilus]MCR8562603.1 rod shape-determining protein MreC [Ohessyouella blattaphilus]
MEKKNRHRVKSKYWLLILILVSLLIITVDSVTGGKTPLRYLTAYTVLPFQEGVSKIGKWTSDLKDNFQTLEELQKKNQHLEAQVEELKNENTTLRQDTFELERLRELFKLDDNYLDYEKVGARVIANNSSNWYADFTIDKGSNDGIKVNANVLAGQGLVGIVTEVTPNTARVETIIANNMNISGMVLTTSDTCVIRGDLQDIASGKIRFEKLANNDNEVKIGDEVVTSHISPYFVQGLLIGKISEIEVDANNLTRSGYITPVADFSTLYEVLVITETKEDLVGSKESE